MKHIFPGESEVLNEKINKVNEYQNHFDPKLPVNQNHFHRRISSFKIAGNIFFGAVITLVLLIIGKSVSEIIIDSFDFATWYGYSIVFLFAVLFVLIFVYVFQEIYSVIKLNSYDHLKIFLSESKSVNKKIEFDSIREQATLLIRFLEKNNNFPQSKINKTYKDIEFAETKTEVLNAIEENLLKKIDSNVKNIITFEAANVAIGTIISPYAFLDAIIVFYRNIKMIKKIILAYNLKPGRLGTFKIVKNTVFAVATAGLMQEASVFLMAGLQNTAMRLLGQSFIQGSSSAFLTIRVGLAAQEYCRPVPLSNDKYKNIASSILTSVKNIIVKQFCQKNKKINV